VLIGRLTGTRPSSGIHKVPPSNSRTRPSRAITLRPEDIDRASRRFGESRQRPFEFTASAGLVRDVSLRVGECRPGCYTRCHTTWAKSLRPERWAQKAALRSGIELDGVSEPHTLLAAGLVSGLAPWMVERCVVATSLAGAPLPCSAEEL